MINAAPSGQPALRGHREPEALLLSCASGGGLAGWFGRGETQSDPGLTSVSESILQASGGHVRGRREIDSEENAELGSRLSQEGAIRRKIQTLKSLSLALPGLG